MADRIPVYVNQQSQQITELSVNDALDVSTVKATSIEADSLSVNGTAYAPYDDSTVKADISANSSAIADNTSDIAANTSAIQTNAGGISTNASAIQTNAGNISANTTAINSKLDADKIWTGTEAQYNSTSKDSNTLYFITG
jgi:hypothetical protein